MTYLLENASAGELTNPGWPRLLRPSPGVSLNGKLHCFAVRGDVFFNIKTCRHRRFPLAPPRPLGPQAVCSHLRCQQLHFWHGGYFGKALCGGEPVAVPRRESPPPKIRNREEKECCGALMAGSPH